MQALANIFETGIDLLVGMDTIRAEETYRDALLIYPNKPGMILGLSYDEIDQNIKNTLLEDGEDIW